MKTKKEREGPTKVEKNPAAPLENQATSTKPPKAKKERKEEKKPKGPDARIASPNASASILKTPKHLRFTESGEAKPSVTAATGPTPISKGKKSRLVICLMLLRVRYVAYTREQAVAPSPHWYNGLPVLSSLESLPQLSPTEMRDKTHRAEMMLKEEAAYAEENPHLVDAMGTSDRAFLSQILSGGTSSDKLSALTLMAQASPLHNQRALESLKAMAGKKGRQESLKALRALADLWVGGASPERKLK